jgi:hypothetical protein
MGCEKNAKTGASRQTQNNVGAGLARDGGGPVNI